MRKVLPGFLFIISFNVQAQTFEKWANLVQWDGYSPWQNYMIYAAGFMGPNALPVPSLANGSLDSVNNISFSSVFFLNRGDKTQNLKLAANYVLVKNLVSADITWLPVEWFRQSPQTKDDRHVYYLYYNDNRATGDIYFNINLQLLNRWRKFIHLAFRAGFRYPTSSSVGSARYTDAPGYHFDFSFGKFLSTDKKWKLAAMAGFYVWQLNTSGQDDAILYGSGLEYNNKSWQYRLNCRGYSGYRNNGDRPVILSSAVEKKINHISVSAGIFRGLKDYQYTGIELGIKYLFKGPVIIK